MNCIHDGTLRAYLDGELETAEAEGIGQHLETCETCRRQADEAKARSERAAECFSSLEPPPRCSNPKAATPTGICESASSNPNAPPNPRERTRLMLPIVLGEQRRHSSVSSLFCSSLLPGRAASPSNCGGY